MDLNDPLSDACELPNYPATRGPVAMAFSEQTGEVVACGEYGSTINKECFIFDGITWEPLPPLMGNLWPYPYTTKSFFMDGIGLWVGGDDGSFKMVNELFNSEGQWITLPVDSPFASKYYPNQCAVPLNSTHIFFSGGYYNEFLVDTWVLDLENLTWTSSTPMSTPRDGHACVLTADGELLIAGGSGDNGFVPSVQIFNPVSLEWRESGNIPAEMSAYYQKLLLWNDRMILIERYTDRIWEMEENQEWRLLDVAMGSTFDGVYDQAFIVPDSWRNGCF